MLLIGLGHKARHGKDTFANTVKENFGELLDIRLHSFADPLRAEVTAEAYKLFQLHYPANPFNGQRALEIVCDFYNQPFDPTAPVDETYPWGKQRVLLQWWGTEYRRSQDPQYWTSKGRALIQEARRTGADAIIFRDMRFWNEFDLITEEGGITGKIERLFFESGVPEHISETELDSAPFGFHLAIPDGQLELLQEMSIQIFQKLYIRSTSTELSLSL
jgi:hypothetical protein